MPRRFAIFLDILDADQSTTLMPNAKTQVVRAAQCEAVFDNEVIFDSEAGHLFVG